MSDNRPFTCPGLSRNRRITPKPQAASGTLPHATEGAKRTLKAPNKKCIRTEPPLAWGETWAVLFFHRRRWTGRVSRRSVRSRVACNGRTSRRRVPARRGDVPGQQSRGPRWGRRPTAWERGDRAGHARTRRTGGQDIRRRDRLPRPVWACGALLNESRWPSSWRRPLGRHIQRRRSRGSSTGRWSFHRSRRASRRCPRQRRRRGSDGSG